MSDHIKVYSRDHVLNVLIKAGVPAKSITLLDTHYVYLSNSKADSFFFNLSAQVIDTFKYWKAESRDCDKYSRVLQAVGIMSHALQWDKKSSDPAGLTLGVFNFTRTSGGHSINCIVTKADGKEEFYLRFFEPQSGEETTLSATEIKSTHSLLI